MADPVAGERAFDVGANAWGWTPWGLPMAVGMALDLMDRPRAYWTNGSLADQLEEERRLPDNQFTQNARAADRLILLHRLARAMPVHDRPMRFARMAGAYERPDDGLVQPHALWAMEHGDA